MPKKPKKPPNPGPFYALWVGFARYEKKQSKEKEPKKTKLFYPKKPFPKKRGPYGVFKRKKSRFPLGPPPLFSPKSKKVFIPKLWEKRIKQPFINGLGLFSPV